MYVGASTCSTAQMFGVFAQGMTIHEPRSPQLSATQYVQTAFGR